MKLCINNILYYIIYIQLYIELYMLYTASGKLYVLLENSQTPQSTRNPYYFCLNTICICFSQDLYSTNFYIYVHIYTHMYTNAHVQ